MAGSCNTSSVCHFSPLKPHHAMVNCTGICQVLSNRCFLTLNIYFGAIICSDFLTRSYDIGGIVRVMALSSLFILMTQHGLEYPNFYNKLYALLEPSVFMAKHRSKFFQVSDIQSHWTINDFVNLISYPLLVVELESWEYVVASCTQL